MFDILTALYEITFLFAKQGLTKANSFTVYSSWSFFDVLCSTFYFWHFMFDVSCSTFHVRRFMFDVWHSMTIIITFLTKIFSLGSWEVRGFIKDISSETKELFIETWQVHQKPRKITFLMDNRGHYLTTWYFTLRKVE